MNSNITFEIVEKNFDKHWDDWYLSNNPNLRFHNINNIETIYSINLDMLCDNKFTLEKDLFFRTKLREWFKKSDLKRELIANLWHPKNCEKFKYYDPEMFSEEEE